MSEQICRNARENMAGFRWLLLVFLLMQGSDCLADELASGTGTAPDIVNPADIGVPDDGREKARPKVEDLGAGKYRIGTINIDKVKHRITVPGVMLPYEENKAIEFLATTRHGYKSYESVLMLETNAFEFNLACILIGLDSKQAVLPEYHFDPQPVKGDPVSIKVAWETNGKMHEYDAIELLKYGEGKPARPAVWSYTGSMFIEGDRYLAQMDGVLIGLIHDPASIIEHRDGLGLGRFGAVTVNPDRAPRSGQVVNVTIQGTASAGND
jgi:hypothetical protein